MGTRAGPSPYPAFPFHAIRTISFLSASIISGILVWFSIQLKNDGYKIPWTFLVIAATSIPTIIITTFTFLLTACSSLSPLFNLVLNIPLLVLWIGAFSLLTWNLDGMLARSCTITNWGSSAGVTICEIYKVLYSCMFFSALSHIALVVLDVRARRYQNRLGKYDKMMAENSDAFSLTDTKPDGYSHANSTDLDVPLVPIAHRTNTASSDVQHVNSRDDQPYGAARSYSRADDDRASVVSSTHGWRPPVVRQYTNESEHHHQQDRNANAQYYSRNDFESRSPVQQTTYHPRRYATNFPPSPGYYGQDQRRGHGDGTYYDRRS